MKCPHCLVEIHEGFEQEWLAHGAGIGTEGQVATNWRMTYMTCPACSRAILKLHKHQQNRAPKTLMVYPRSMSRPQAPADVPGELAEDFNEACAVLADSAKASAALSRRCLQQLLRLQGYTQHDLAKAIDAILIAKALPGSLAANLDAVRNIGNFAAHPIKDKNSGAIVAVEPEEAEWNLDVLDGLFEFFYVQPARDAARIAALNAKLAAAGKPPMKQ